MSTILLPWWYKLNYNIRIIVFPKKNVNWISYGALWPMIAKPWNKFQTSTPHNSKDVVYVIIEHSEITKTIFSIGPAAVVISSRANPSNPSK